MSVTWDKGALCWARALNENYVRANLTATIAWSLIASFYDSLPFGGTGLLHAVEPWSGFYEVGQALWTVAHWGQFTAAGWFFLQHGKGVGFLDNGGSYVALTDQTGQQLTIIIETMKHDSSQCMWSNSPNYNITDQTATFQLDDSFAHITQLFVFFSDLTAMNTNESFIYKGVVTLDNRSFTLQLPIGVVYTLSTLNGTKGTYTVPPSMPFPVPYQDNFDKYPVASEAAYFADQSGSFEIVDTSSSRGKVMRQMATELPISWCGEAPYPFSLIGDARWQQPLNISVDVMIENVGTAFIALEVARGSCNTHDVGSPGIVFSINTTNNGLWQLSANTAMIKPLSSGSTPVTPGTWYTLMLSVLTDHSEAYINGQLIGRCALNVTSSRGWAAIGSSWDHVQFDNFHLY
jgi:galactosylceramidase